jgi:glycerophosphoryl diester phosphodiesterase
MAEVFDFVACADPARAMRFNIESKIDAAHPNNTRGVDDFVAAQHAVFAASPYRTAITYESFDWRTIVAMKARRARPRAATRRLTPAQELDPRMTTSALIELDTTTAPDGGPSPWLAGLVLADLGGPGDSTAVRIARAAARVRADILSPAAGTGGNGHGVVEWVPFTTRAMVQEAHALGLRVKPWTVNNLDVMEAHHEWGVDGVITDCEMLPCARVARVADRERRRPGCPPPLGKTAGPTRCAQVR